MLASLGKRKGGSLFNFFNNKHFETLKLNLTSVRAVSPFPRASKAER
ncbi:MAG: hypothetical protein U5L45_26945 [Saprospiraceae bacterium]|nr:hypothetical protein [Saprospiraceae bacterium]